MSVLCGSRVGNGISPSNSGSRCFDFTVDSRAGFTQNSRNPRVSPKPIDHLAAFFYARGEKLELGVDGAFLGNTGNSGGGGAVHSSFTGLMEGSRVGDQHGFLGLDFKKVVDWLIFKYTSFWLIS